MDVRELRALHEAYTHVYQPQELTEEVEIATEYFYEMGLNENGIDILVEELGEEEFVNWVYDIAEEYILNEADQTRLQKMAAAKGKIVTGPKGSRPQSTTKSAIQKMGGTTKRIGSSQRPGSTISGKREKAASTAVSQQKPTPAASSPQQTKKGMGGLIGSLVQRAKQDTALLGKSIQTARDVASRRGAEVAAGYSALRARGREAEQSPAATRARRVATVAAGRAAQAAGRTAIKAAGAAGAAAGAGVASRRAGATGAQTAGRVAGTFVRKMREDVDLYDIILSHLLDEGYAETPKAAEAIMVNMSEDWRDTIIDEATAMARRGLNEPEIRQQIASRTGGGAAADRASALEKKSTFGDTNKEKQRQRLARAQRGDFRSTASSSPGLRVGQFKSNDPEVQAKQAARGAQRSPLTPAERKQFGR